MNALANCTTPIFHEPGKKMYYQEENKTGFLFGFFRTHCSNPECKRHMGDEVVPEPIFPDEGCGKWENVSQEEGLLPSSSLFRH